VVDPGGCSPWEWRADEILPSPPDKVMHSTKTQNQK